MWQLPGAKGDGKMSTEVLAVVALALLRLGLPLLFVFGASYIAYRWIGAARPVRPAAPQPGVSIGGPAPVARVLYTGPYCWAEKHCTAEQQTRCPAFARPELPCWLAVQMKTGHLRADCPDCHFYERPVVRA